MGKTSEEALDMTQAEALDRICTHVCRKDPTLRLNPEHCTARRNQKRKISNPYLLANWQIHRECIGCEGPLPREERDGR